MTLHGNPARRLAALALTAVLAAGCGGDSTPAEAAPELAEQLARVDRAVTTGDEARIRERVESLVAATEAARDAGRIDDEQADRILTAADALLARLPAEEPPSESPSPPTSSPTTETPEPPEDDEGDEGDEGDNSGPGGGDSKGKPEKEEKPEKGKGHGKG
jgi:hypothetical protein